MTQYSDLGQEGTMENKNRNRIVELPLNKDPEIRILTDHMTICQICSSNMAAGDKLAEVEISDAAKSQWTDDTYHLSLVDENNKLAAYSHNKYSKGMQGFRYRDCLRQDEIIIKIDYQQYTCAWATISLVITEGRCDPEVDKSDFICEFSNYSKTRLHISSYGVYYNIAEQIYDQQYPVWLKMTKDDNDISISSSFNGVEWIPQGGIVLEEIENKKLVVGVRINMLENQWYNWLYTNYIQIVSTPKAGVQADYLMNVYKNWHYSHVNMFLEYGVEDMEVIKELAGFADYVKANLMHGRYIQLGLDEFYLSGRQSYQSNHRSHFNLIYGYNDEEKYFMSTGIDLDGYPCYTNIDYSVLPIAVESCTVSLQRIITVKYEPDGVSFKTNIKQIVRFLEDYVEGRNSSEDISYIVARIEGAFGIKLYEEYVKDEYYNIFLEDIRIAYLIYEHKKIMLERLDYLVKKEIIPEEEITGIKAEVLEIYRLSDRIKNLMVKLYITNKSHIKDTIKQTLSEIKEKEIICYGKLIDLLKTKM